MRVEFDIVPIPASRPRVTRWATYYGKKYSQFKENMEALTSDTKFTPLEGNIYASLRFYIQIPKSWSKKKKKVNKKHRKSKARVKALKVASLSKINKKIAPQKTPGAKIEKVENKTDQEPVGEAGV